jgi:hypothetical protein
MTKKKRLGSKAQIRAIKERERRIATAIFLTIILSSAAFSAYFGYTLLSPSPDLSFTESTLQFKPENPNPELKAAIVDQLSLTYPNQTFIEAATSILKQVGYSVDYYRGEEVTVEFYTNLPTHNYELIILRVHSTASGLSQGQFVTVPVFLFTSEIYSTTRHVSEQLSDEVFRAAYNTPGSKDYFAIGPNFVLGAMAGGFKNTTIIMMGCEGLKNTETAEAFIERGAKAYIGWNGSVPASHTDQATTCLLKHLITQKEAIKQAVENTMKEVGPDPVHNSLLTYYPLGAG